MISLLQMKIGMFGRSAFAIFSLMNSSFSLQEPFIPSGCMRSPGSDDRMWMAGGSLSSQRMVAVAGSCPIEPLGMRSNPFRSVVVILRLCDSIMVSPGIINVVVGI